MIPVTMARLENYAGFLLSLDNETWWKSQPLPGNIDYFTDAVWIYGQYHICSARLINGTYSIFFSDDNGFSWTSVVNTAEKINCLLRPDYGRALAATSGGWWRSENSGKTWTKVSTQAPNCHTVKELTRDILVALDGTYIWRSIDSGTTWNKAMKGATRTPVTAITNYPTIDGTYNDCIVGCTSTNQDDAPHSMHFYPNWDEFGWWVTGPFADNWLGVFTQTSNRSAMTKPYKDKLLYSDDGAATFWIVTVDGGWSLRESIIRETETRLGSVDNGWEQRSYYAKDYALTKLFPRDTYNDIITDIELTGVNSNGLPEFCIQVKMSNGVLRHYWVRRIVNVGAVDKQFWVKARFDAQSSLSNSLVSEMAQITGTDTVQYITVFAGTNGIYPVLKISFDGGETWSDYDVSNSTVYNGPDLSQLSITNPFIEDIYLKYAWSMPGCHNGWHPVTGYSEKNQSYDMDFITAVTHDTDTYGNSYTMDTLIGKIKAKTYSMDVLNGRIQHKTYSTDVLNRDTHIKSVYLDEVTRKTCMETITSDMVSVLRKTKGVSLDALLLKTCVKNFSSDVLLEKTPEDSYSMGMMVQDTIVQDILQTSQRYGPQFQSMGLGWEKRSYPIFDSRKETKV